jgi:multimeric flavodoxin WrbA
MVSLAGKEIADCRHCNWCVRKQVEGQPCVQLDDMHPLYQKLLDADGIILATPVYIGRLSGYLATFMDRLRVFVHGNVYRGGLADKVGGAMAVGWFRNAGMETALQSVVVGIMVFQMIPVSGLACPWGAPALASKGGTGQFDKDNRHGVLDDDLGLMAAKSLVERMVSLARRLKSLPSDRETGSSADPA